ncbi:protein cereblon-like [Toxorhynchites rutilus septentrionalis]|uniref:protein cereblon-like n=1 Tax=Toxorhynchites rutilus septentrionalis TaxID=329112 RepID=UPI00247AFBC6|nr:protein cereblon-like [Toxorhynchites rutilus septentrionalis]
MCFRRFYSNMKLRCLRPEDDENVELVNRVSLHDRDNGSVPAGPSTGTIHPQQGYAIDGLRNRFKLTYNIQLPSEHAYLGKLERVECLERFEPGSIHRIPVSSHHSIVYPGETIPLILTNSLLDFDGRYESSRIGLVFWEHSRQKRILGVVCQVCEKDVRESVIVLKTIAQQRFELVPQRDGALTRSVQRDGRAHYYAEVKILPEVLLPDPLASFCTSNMVKINNIAKNRLLAAQSSVWPKFVYDQYGSNEVLYKVRRFLEFLQIESVPTADPVMLSFWLARNIPLSETDRKELFFSNSVLSRMLLVNNILDYTCAFCCKKCDRRIANYVDMFAMSKQGVSSSYCNPSGFIHETLTVYRVVPKTARTTTKPSTDFSWFPGYSWQIAVCNACNNHIGWKFAATKRNYKPKKFYGLCGKSIRVASDRKVDDVDPGQHSGGGGGANPISNLRLTKT